MPTKEEFLFAHKAMELGFINSTQFDEILKWEEQYRIRGENISILQIMLGKKLLTPEQMIVIQQAVNPLSKGEATTLHKEKPVYNSYVQEINPPSTFSSLPGDSFATEYGKKDTQEKLGRYTIKKKIAEGGMGIIYQAYDPRLDRAVAIKILKPDTKVSSQSQLRFLREAKANAKLKHPHIIAIHDIDYEDQENQYFFVMDFISGMSLKKYLSQKISLLQIVDIMIKASSGIAYAHENGMIHRDLKPANIMIDSEGEPIITDFGLVKIVEDSLSISGSGIVLGTFHYMAPEQSEELDEVDEQSDVYSLGVMLYEMLTGELPFKGNTPSALIHQIGYAEVVSPEKIDSKIPIEIAKICLKAMAREKDNRYANAKSLLKELENFKEEYFSTSAKKEIITKRVFKKVSKKPTTTSKDTNRRTAQEMQPTSPLPAAQTLADKKGYIAILTLFIGTSLGVFYQHLQAKKHWQTLIQKEQKNNKNTKKRIYFSTIMLAQKLNEDTQIEKVHHILDSEDWCPTEFRKWEWEWQRHQKQDQSNYHIPLHSCAFAPDNLNIAILPRSPLPTFILIDQKNKKNSKNHIANYGLVTSCAFSPDGKSLVITYDTAVCLWDIAANSKRHTFKKHTKLIATSAFHPKNNNRFVTAGHDKKLIEWDIQSKKFVREYIHDAKIHHCTFSPDGKMLASLDTNNVVTLWDYQKQTTIFTLKLNKSTTKCVFSPDSKKIACALGQEVVLYEIASKEEIARFSGHTKKISSCIFSPDGTRLVSVGEDKMVFIWDTKGEKYPLTILKGHQSKINDCAFSPDGKIIISVAEDGELKYWGYER